MEYRREDGNVVVVKNTSEIIGKRKKIIDKKIKTERTIFNKSKSRVLGGSVSYTTLKEKE